jgi:hypothetical protein
MEIIKRDNKAYLVQFGEDWELPRIISSWFEISIDPTLIPDNCNIYRLGNAYIINTGYKTLALNIPEYPTFIEFTAIKPPKKSGYIWKYGRWSKK